jgi:hypothetical protein
MPYSSKRGGMGSVAALAIVAAVTLASPSTNAAPLPGEGSMATFIHNQGIQPVTDVAWRRHHYWAPGAVAAGAALGLFGAALAAPAYATGYCDPYYGCGLSADYYAYYSGPSQGYYNYGYYPSQNYDLYGGGGDGRIAH